MRRRSPYASLQASPVCGSPYTSRQASPASRQASPASSQAQEEDNTKENSTPVRASGRARIFSFPSPKQKLELVSNTTNAFHPSKSGLEAEPSPTFCFPSPKKKLEIVSNSIQTTNVFHPSKYGIEAEPSPTFCFPSAKKKLELFSNSVQTTNVSHPSKYDLEAEPSPTFSYPSPEQKLELFSNSAQATNVSHPSKYDLEVEPSVAYDSKSSTSPKDDLRLVTTIIRRNDEKCEVVIGRGGSIFLEDSTDISQEQSETVCEENNDSAPIGNLPSELHEICQNANSVEDLMRAKSFLASQKSRDSNFALKTDGRGRTPMHLFSSNKDLAIALGTHNEFDLETREYFLLNHQPSFDQDAYSEKKLVRFVVGELLTAYPGAMMIRDDHGHIPFQGALVEWVDICHDRRTSNYSRPTVFSPFTGAAEKLTQVWETTSTTVLSAVKLAGRHIKSSASGGNVLSEDIEVGIGPAKQHSLHQESGEKSGNNDQRFPSNVQLSHHVRFILVMLSAIVDRLDQYMSPESIKRGEFGDLQADSFDRVISELRSFREIYGSVDISATIVQAGKFYSLDFSCAFMRKIF
jgi:hypothetical protein